MAETKKRHPNFQLAMDISGVKEIATPFQMLEMADKAAEINKFVNTRLTDFVEFLNDCDYLNFDSTKAADLIERFNQR